VPDFGTISPYPQGNQERLVPPKENVMNFVSIRIITADITRLARFYEQVTGIALTMYTQDFGELKTPGCTLAIGSTRTLQLFGGDVARPADNHTAIIEFRVGDVDAEYRRLADVIGDSLVQKPTTMPWGNRSLLFRDPDGTLVNFFTPVSAEAIKKFGE
jgi:predicted enzyme related to lactoylglutathione lyase